MQVSRRQLGVYMQREASVSKQKLIRVVKSNLPVRMKNVTSCSFFVDVLHLDIEVERLFCKKARTRPVLQGRKSIEKKSAHQISNFRDGPSTSTVIGLFSFNRVPTSQLPPPPQLPQTTPDSRLDLNFPRCSSAVY